jgi:hypothetical protein
MGSEDFVADLVG